MEHVTTLVHWPSWTAWPAASRAAGHQLTSYDLGAAPLSTTHDGAGRVTRDGTQTFFYDDFDALVAVGTAPTSGNPTLKEGYLHDALGRLVAKTSTSAVTEEYAYDGAQMVAAYTGAGGVLWQAHWGPGLDSLLSVSTAGQEYFAPVVHRPDGTTVPSTSAWIKNNGTGTWHGYPKE